MLHALLIDDEASARADLREKLAAHVEVSVVGEAATIRSARALLASADYDLVFLDVRLIGGESFQLVPDVRPGACIVIATAHERHAVSAFESNVLDYLLKPIDPARLTDALRRAAVVLAAGSGRHPPTPSTAPIPPAARRPVLPVIPATDNAREVDLTGDERVFLRQCLEAWEDSLPATHVLRAADAQTTAAERSVHYQRNREPTRLFLDDQPTFCLRHWWRELCARFGP